jgi:hypothetical protein
MVAAVASPAARVFSFTSGGIAMPGSTPLHDAARLLIAEASPETVRAVLKMLLDAPAAASSTAVRPSLPSLIAAHSGRQRTARRTSAADADWEAVRQRVRSVMTERGATHVDLAAAVGCSASTMRVSLHRRQPASRRLIAALRAWLAANGEQAPEVATPAIPFRSRGGERRGNGGDVGESVATAPASA